MTFAECPVGSLPKDAVEDGRPGASWRSSDIEATFNLPGGMICPVHGGGHAISRREAPPPPPPELRRSCHERSKAKWDDSLDSYHYYASDTFPNDCYCSPNEKAFRPGYGWAEPGKGWTRNPRRPTSHRLRPDAREKTRTTNEAGKGDKTRGEQCRRPSVWDTQWAISYLSRDSDIPRQRASLHSTAEARVERHECQQGSRAAPPGSFKYYSTGYRRQNGGHLAETHTMQHVGCFDLTDKSKDACLYCCALQLETLSTTRYTRGLVTNFSLFWHVGGTSHVFQTCSFSTLPRNWTAVLASTTGGSESATANWQNRCGTKASQVVPFCVASFRANSRSTSSMSFIDD